jgi:hypothetical protein
VRVGGHNAIFVDGDLRRQRRAGRAAQEDAVQRNAAGRHVEQQRFFPGDRHGEAQRVGAVKRFQPVMRHHNGVGVSHADRRKALPCRLDGVTARRPVMRTAAHRDRGNAGVASGRDAFVDGAIAGGVSEPVVGIDMDDRRRRAGDADLGLSVDAPAFKRPQIMRHQTNPMSVKGAHRGIDNRAGYPLGALPVNPRPLK